MRRDAEAVLGMIRVLVVDDHDLVRDEVSAALTDAGGIEVVGTCVDGQQAVERLESSTPMSS